MTSPLYKLHQRVSTNFEDEYVKNIEAKYSITVPRKEPAGDQSMGGALTKLKGTNETSPNVTSSPDKSSGSKLSLVTDSPPNGSTPFAYEKARMKALVSEKRCRMLRQLENKDSMIDENAGGKRKRRQTVEAGTVQVEEEGNKSKRRRTNSLKKQRMSSVRRTQSFDAREIIVAKRAQRLENMKSTGQKEILDFPGYHRIKDEPDSLEVKTINSLQLETQVDSAKDNSSKFDKASIKFVDQNLNHITENHVGENLKELYQKKVKEINESSPLKGKMSAFEISVLKGKQNVERRKSIESATLRSSPRMNSNVPRPNYRDRKKIKQRLSLGSALDRKAETTHDKIRKVRRGIKRTRTVDVVDTLSPDSMENKIIKPVPKRKRPKLKRHSDIMCARAATVTAEDGKKVNYRLNGSPKLKHLPARLSLDNLSGTKDQHQGSAFTSLHKHTSTSKLSGMPSALRSSLVAMSPESCVTQSQQPKSLLVLHTSQVKSPAFDHCFNKAAESAKMKKEMPCKSTDHCCNRVTDTLNIKQEKSCKSKNRKSLEDTVNMLRKNMHKSKESNRGKWSLSPSRSDSRTSRRSSRSSTPNVSPIKSEILTPSSTPCSSRSKSPITTPVSAELECPSRKKKYLFSKHDEVLALWHDGLFYLGKIIKLDERQERCLLIYEDDSEWWSLFKDIHRVLKEEEMICCICLSDVSEPPNEIVLCEYCLQGFHQQCHRPNISSGKIVDPDEPWFCRKCVFLRASKARVDDDLKWGEEMTRMKVCLPYDLNRLTWDQQHKNNIEQVFCYCGGPGIWFQKMLQCCRCKQWFHEVCMQCTEYPLMYADSFYIFVCSPCNSGHEYIRRLDVDWADLVHISLFNMAMLHHRKFFDLHSELMPWMAENWSQLQVPKFGDMTEMERELEVVNALESNPARFVNASELRKRQALWGLRVRVPPPRIQITLPYKGQISDQVMNKLKIKGRRSKVFTPVECKSPVNKITYSPLHPGRLMKKKLNVSALPQDQEPVMCESLSESIQEKTLPFLDTVFPQEETFNAQNHPFKTELEQNENKTEMLRREKVWNKFLSLFGGSDDIESNTGTDDFVQDEPPVLEKVEPVVPIISCNGTPPMPEIQDKKAQTKLVPKLEKNLEKSAKDRRTSRRHRTSTPVDVKVESDKSGADFTVKHIKTVAGGNFYCVYDATGYGKGFSVMGRRVNKVGQVEYMVKWD